MLRKNICKCIVSRLCFNLPTFGIELIVLLFRIGQLMREYCNEALQFGETESFGKEFRKVIVVLNPVANRR